MEIKELSFQELVDKKNITNILKRAKDIYVQQLFDIPVHGMCKAIQLSFEEMNNISPDETLMEILIPQFNKSFCNAPIDNNKSVYWWNIKDKSSRVKAFNKLINYYEQKQ